MSGYTPQPYVPQPYVPGGGGAAAPAPSANAPSSSTYQPASPAGFAQALNNPPPPAAPQVYTSATPATTVSQRQPEYNPAYPADANSYKPETSNTAYGGAYPSTTTGASVPIASSVGFGPSPGLVTNHGNPQICHRIDYQIKGYEMQLVEIELDQHETVIAEAGAMMYMDDGIEFKTKFGDGSEPKQGFFKKLMSAGGRLLTGESLFLTHFTNKGPAGSKARVAFAAPHPGTIVPLDLGQFGGKLICQKDAFLCAAKGTKLQLHFNKKIGSGFFGGEGFILQKLKGDGLAFMHAGGTIIQRELRGERLRVDTGCLVAFTDGINFDIQMAPGLKTMIFGGEGIFLATLQGTGTVWMQSLPFSRMADQIVRHAPSIGGRQQGESDLVGTLMQHAF